MKLIFSFTFEITSKGCSTLQCCSQRSHLAFRGSLYSFYTSPIRLHSLYFGLLWLGIIWRSEVAFGSLLYIADLLCIILLCEAITEVFLMQETESFIDRKSSSFGLHFSANSNPFRRTDFLNPCSEQVIF